MKAENILSKKIIVANIGLEKFYNELKKQDIQCVQIDWKPPAGGNEELIKILDRLNDKEDIDEYKRS